jgi:hypothetical protein
VPPLETLRLVERQEVPVLTLYLSTQNSMSAMKTIADSPADVKRMHGAHQGHRMQKNRTFNVQINEDSDAQHPMMYSAFFEKAE